MIIKSFRSIVITFIATIFIASFSYAQSPGGVATGLVGWHRADIGTGVVVDGATVQTWQDQSAANHDFFQNTANQRPAYNDDANNINFNQYINFDGINDYFRMNNSADFNTSAQYEKSFSIVFRTSNDIVTRQVLYEEGGGSRGLNMYIFNSELYFAGWNFPNDGADAPWVWSGHNEPINTNTTYIATFILEGNATITGEIRAYLNGELVGTLPNIGRLYTHGAAIGLGAKRNTTVFETGNSGGTGNYYEGDISEFAYYNATAHTATELNQVESYLALKYGITLDQTPAENYVDSSGTVVYASTTTHSSYANDIAGIAIDNGSNFNQPQSQSVNTDSVVSMSNASAMADGEFLVWGNDNDDNGSIEEISTGTPATVLTRLDRVWRVDQEGDVGTVTVSFDVSGLTQSGTAASDFAILIDSSNSDFTAGARMRAAASFAGGIVTFNNIDFTGDDYFTLATTITQPLVTLSATPLTVAENGGTSTILASLNGPWHSDVTVNLSYSGTASGTDYSAASSILVATDSLSNSIILTAIDDPDDEPDETVVIDINTVVNGTESGTQQTTVTITDDDVPSINACAGQESIYTSELAGEVNFYDLNGVYQSTFNTGNSGIYEMIIDPDNLFNYYASYDNMEIFRTDLDGSNQTTLHNTAPNRPFQIAIDPGNNKIYWTDWSANANIFCKNLDGTGPATAIATGLYYPTGMKIDLNTNTMYTYYGYASPVRLDSSTLDGNCGPITFTNVRNTGLNLAFNLSLDPPGNRLFFVDFGAQTITKINTDGTGLVPNLWSLTAPGDQMRDIVYNKNNDQLYWVHTNGSIQNANADGTGVVNTLTLGIDPTANNRSIDICVDAVPPKLVSFTSTSTDQLYCPSTTINITATYDEPIIAGSTLTVVLDTGASVVLNNLGGPGNTQLSGTYTVGATGSGENTSDLTVASISSESVTDDDNNTRTTSTVPASPNNIADTSDIIVDTAPPNLGEVMAVTSPTLNRNPTYIFSSDDTGPITYGGKCDGDLNTAAVGNNTVTFDIDGAGGPLPDDTYDDCTISVLDSAGCNLGTRNVSTFIVAADVPTVTLSIDNASIAENAGVATVTATLSNIYAAPVTVNLGFSGDATGGGTDYTASGTSIVINPLSTTGTITITADQDNIDENNESVVVDITSVTNGTESGVQQVTTSIIDDDPPPTVTLSLDNATISESGGVATFTATLNTVSGLPVTVNLAFSGVANGGGDDYNASSSSIVISTGSLSNTMTVSAVDDPNYEPNETVIVDINTVTNGTESGTQQQTTTIIEDIICNYDPYSTPSGTTAFATITFDGSFDPGGSFMFPSGADFDTTVMGRNAAQADAWRATAFGYFNATFGIDFSVVPRFDVDGDGFDEYIYPNLGAPQIVLDHTSTAAAYNPRDFVFSGYRLVPDGGTVYTGAYSMIVIDTFANLTGTWGGAGTLVPQGTVAEFGEYAVEVAQFCKDFDGDNETHSITTMAYLAWQSSNPTLADFIGFLGGFYIDSPQVFEYDLNAGDGIHTYAYTSGSIFGRKEIRQVAPNQINTAGTIILTVP